MRNHDEGKERRAALVEAAFHAIARSGFEGLRLRDVATTVGIDHSTLHHYFATKQHLIEAVVLRATTPLHGTIADGGGDRLSKHLLTLAAAIEEKPELFVVLAEIDLRARRDPSLRAIIDRVEQGWRLGLGGLLDHDDASIELVIATVKGVRLDPASATEVLTRLARLLTQRRTHGDEGK